MRTFNSADFTGRFRVSLIMVFCLQTAFRFIKVCFIIINQTAFLRDETRNGFAKHLLLRPPSISALISVALIMSLSWAYSLSGPGGTRPATIQQ